ncbi:hypothetical protein H9L05_00245 [Hymenobacter qilianensis]|uniref:Oligopeptide transport permease C-like N-terminal domain-containing protein n=1 Tax=Hymenobacter qilianensis TaxID=1385715 RepID=A0A7H0GVI0_9BACT|nr:hypothetical protein [Hymenobacter qilianensis]QNP52296.1 hypothetical protein H9L05_00245 [Hymenobacter qilianensis]
MATAAPVLAPVAPATPPARPPGYYVRRRLWRNGPAMFGLGFILICTLIALAGYWVLPDNSPNANNGLVQLQKEPPGFSATVLRRPCPKPRRAPIRIISSVPGSGAARRAFRKCLLAGIR